MPHIFDHLVLPAHDLNLQAAHYRRLGFHVGVRNAHPWGTENHIIQLDGAFLELIGIAAGAHLPGPHPAPNEFSFGGFVGQYLAHREGLAMLALQTDDARVEALRYAAAGIGAFSPFHFSRGSTRPDGLNKEVSFTLAFAESSLIPDAGFFACQSHQTRYLWSSSSQVHPNTAQVVSGIVMLADNPSDHAEFLAHFLEQREMLATSMGLEIDTGGGVVEVLTSTAARFRYGSAFASDGETKPHLVAYRIAVAHIAATEECLFRGGVEYVARGKRLVVPALANFGAALIFETSA